MTDDTKFYSVAQRSAQLGRERWHLASTVMNALLGKEGRKREGRWRSFCWMEGAHSDNDPRPHLFTFTIQVVQSDLRTLLHFWLTHSILAVCLRKNAREGNKTGMVRKCYRKCSCVNSKQSIFSKLEHVHYSYRLLVYTVCAVWEVLSISKLSTFATKLFPQVNDNMSKAKEEAKLCTTHARPVGGYNESVMCTHKWYGPWNVKKICDHSINVSAKKSTKSVE